MLHQKGFKIRKFRERNVRLTQPKAVIFFFPTEQSNSFSSGSWQIRSKSGLSLLKFSLLKTRHLFTKFELWFSLHNNFHGNTLRISWIKHKGTKQEQLKFFFFVLPDHVIWTRFKIYSIIFALQKQIQ